MLDLINTPPHKIVFLGPGCSIATKPIAEAASYWQAVQVSVRNKSNKIISKKMKNKKQIKQTIKTMKQVSCTKKKTKKKLKHNKRGVRLFFRILLESEHQPEAARIFFLSKVKLQISSPMSEDRHVSDNLIRTGSGGGGWKCQGDNLLDLDSLCQILSLKHEMLSRFSLFSDWVQRFFTIFIK